MLFGKIIETYQATDVITYKLVSYENVSFSIWKCDTKHDRTKNICGCIKSRDAVMLIWSDVLAGLQK